MLLPPEIEKAGVKASSNLDEALKEADAVNVLRSNSSGMRGRLFRNNWIITRNSGLPRKGWQRSRRT
jgi:hypothetical protein